ncbi:MAG: DEAD/DEAH box helicase [Candidatus Sumerlaeaceae bacterium]|nr:DEAD/DEAH box helicase [Candidatus Sumerlaeaceae bacterium]
MSNDDLLPSDNVGKSGVNEALRALLDVAHLRRNLTHVERIPARPAQYSDFPAGLDPRVATALRSRGIERLYTHQASAVDAVLAGRDVIVVTPTASGKTLCFNIPVVHELLQRPEARALYMFPTKALAQDQYLELHELTRAAGGGMKVYTFDGDTPANARRAIRNAGNIVLTNPDMLHTGILPNHTGWLKLFENLRFVVIDEIHHYRGVFGSHVANVLRRLARICEFYGSRPQFICCSATIANPAEAAWRLTGREFELIAESGAPSGEKYFLFYNPPVVNEELGIRRGVVNEARRIATRFLAADVQTIVFARSRMRVEVLLNYLKKTMTKLHRSPARIAGYRGGYLPNERRLIEQGVKSGEILGVVSTNALELGIDIGQLRAAIIAGYPGSVASTWQQAGRAGRKAETAVVVLIGSSSPLDQYVVTHPGYFFGRAPESAIVNPDNVAILANHVKCAAFELPFVDGEPFGGLDPEPILQHLADEHVLHHSGNKWHWSSDTFPAEHISLRSASAENFVVINVADRNRVMAEVDYDSAPFLIHTEAIYMHGGETFYIENLDWDRRTAYARPQRVDYYTDALAKTDLRVLRTDLTESADGITPEPPARHAPREGEFPLPAMHDGAPPAARDLPPSGPETVRERMERDTGQLEPPPVSSLPDNQLNLTIPPPLLSRNFGEVVVSTVISKYKKIRFETHENVGYGDISVPPLEMQTEAFWLTLRPETRDWMELARLDLAAALGGVAQLMSTVVPLFVLCDPRDVACVPLVRSPHDELPAIYLYDKYPGGIGLARKVYDFHPRILIASLDILARCGCGAGCPSCVGPEVELSARAKLGARVLLEALCRTVPAPANH